MPTRTLLRFWCNECQEFTLHYTTGEKECSTCGTVTTSYKYSEIPKEKLLAQRKKYTESQGNIFDVFTKLLEPRDPFIEMFRDEPRTEIIEDDAGQKRIDEEVSKARNRRWAEKREKREALKAEYKKFKGTERNALCPCGSGKKYKKCHLPEFESL